MQRECSFIAKPLSEETAQAASVAHPDAAQTVAAAHGVVLETPARLNADAVGSVRRRRLRTHRFVSGEEARALEFLNRQPLRNLQMIGLIRDHGLEDPRNRGTFYGCVTKDDDLTGVALVGHWVFLSGDEAAVAAFARLARLRHRPEVRVLLGEEMAAGEFDRVFTQSPEWQNVERAESQLLFAAKQVTGEERQVRGLRLAETSDAEEVAEIHALACLEHTGVDPSKDDPAGFRERVLARIRMGRTWITREDDRRITFKTDIASETDRAVYLEGVWTTPVLRRRGVGSAALKDICQRLLHHRRVVCLFADADAEHLTSFYSRVGFEMLAPYRLIRYCH